MTNSTTRVEGTFPGVSEMKASVLGTAGKICSPRNVGKVKGQKGTFPDMPRSYCSNSQVCACSYMDANSRQIACANRHVLRLLHLPSTPMTLFRSVGASTCYSQFQGVGVSIDASWMALANSRQCCGKTGGVGWKKKN